jgi:hypothetical protein
MLAAILTLQPAAAQDRCVPTIARGQLPDADLRAAAFDEAGIVAEVAYLDALDKDLLFMRAQYFTAEQYRVAYPFIAEERLAALRRVVEALTCTGPPAE